MVHLYAVLATTTAAATTTGTVIAGFAASAGALDLERVAAEVDTVHLMNGVVGIAWIVVLQKSKLHFDGDVANAAKFAKKLVQLTLADVSWQIADVNPAHVAIGAASPLQVKPFESFGDSSRQSHRDTKRYQ
jgi:hypothetical protein